MTLRLHLSGLLVVLMSLGCLGGPSRTPDDAPERTPVPEPEESFSILGFRLGDTQEQAKAILPSDVAWVDATGMKSALGAKVATYTVTHLGRDWELTVGVNDRNVTGILLFSSEADPPSGNPKIEAVSQLASDLCLTLPSPSLHLASWASSPEKRYSIPFSEAQKGYVTLGCQADPSEQAIIAGVAHDAALVLWLPKSKGAEAMEQFHFLPFDWRSHPHVGDPIVLGSFKYVIQNAAMVQQVGTNQFLRKKASKGAAFIVFRYTIENTSNATETVISSDLFLQDERGRTFQPSSEATNALAMDEEVDLFLSQLQPGIPRDQVAVFEIPKESADRFDLVIPEKGLLGTERVVMPFTFRELENP